MSKWIDLDLAERRVVLQSVEDKEKLQQVAAIEKDWWVTAVLKALFQTSFKDALSFKGGTSLSKGWGIIERLSEDIDLALDHSFFGMDRTNKKQRDNLCMMARAYIITTLKDELDARLKGMGVTGYSVNYGRHSPDRIDFLPPASELENWRSDYAEMQRHFIFGKALPFDDLLKRMEELRERFRAIGHSE